MPLSQIGCRLNVASIVTCVVPAIPVVCVAPVIYVTPVMSVTTVMRVVTTNQVVRITSRVSIIPAAARRSHAAPRGTACGEIPTLPLRGPSAVVMYPLTGCHGTAIDRRRGSSLVVRRLPRRRLGVG